MAYEYIPGDLLEELEAVFRENARSALRHAARLGALLCKPEIARVRGKVIGLGRLLVWSSASSSPICRNFLSGGWVVLVVTCLSRGSQPT